MISTSSTLITAFIQVNLHPVRTPTFFIVLALFKY
jgi:hypothetical protein